MFVTDPAICVALCSASSVTLLSIEQNGVRVWSHCDSDPRLGIFSPFHCCVSTESVKRVFTGFQEWRVKCSASQLNTQCGGYFCCHSLNLGKTFRNPRLILFFQLPFFVGQNQRTTSQRRDADSLFHIWGHRVDTISLLRVSFWLRISYGGGTITVILLG